MSSTMIMAQSKQLYMSTAVYNVCMGVYYCIGCPPPGIGFCIEACSSDNDCASGQLCCSNGCGHECMVDQCAVSIMSDY